MSKKTNFKYSIFINQKAIIDNNIDIALDEAVILSHFMDLKASSSMHTIIDENKEWMWVSHSKILNDLPMLGIKTAQSVINKINRLIELGFIEKYSKNINKKRSYYALTNKCALLLYDNNATLKNNLGSDIHPKENFSVNDKNNLGSTLKNNLGDYTISKDNSISDKEKEFKNSSISVKNKKFNFFNELKKDFADVDIQILEDYMQVRKDKRASNTKTAYTKLKNQIEAGAKKGGWNETKIFELIVSKSWQGFNADWLDNQKDIAQYGVNGEKINYKDNVEVMREKHIGSEQHDFGLW